IPNSSWTSRATHPAASSPGSHFPPGSSHMPPRWTFAARRVISSRSPCQTRAMATSTGVSELKLALLLSPFELLGNPPVRARQAAADQLAARHPLAGGVADWLRLARFDAAAVGR